MERRYVNDVVKGAPRRLERGLEIFESQPDLLFKVWLGSSIGTAADLAGNEKKVTGSNGGRIAVFFVKRVPVGRENCVAFSHLASLFWLSGSGRAKRCFQSFERHLTYVTYAR
ncbi:hypothetical protein AGR6A_Cc80175 [Agrobacterium sp. NCPPB 925]|nr:hypothetical protein AGR6A_Cc80175 [Agrobacterium sp. NCPPB 925]